MNEPYRRYWGIAKAHRLLLSVPIVIALVISAWYVLTTPKQYEAKTSIWYDTPVPQPSAVVQTDPAVRTPAAQQQVLLNEHLSTRSFRIKVAEVGPLAEYLATHDEQAAGPIAILQKLRGEKSLDDRAVDALSSSNVTTEVVGLQVLAISFKGPSPEVALGTLNALVDEFNREVAAARQARDDAQVKYFQEKVDSTSKALADAQAAIAQYVRSNPARPDNDPQLVTLTQTASAIATQLADANNSLNQAIIEQRNLASTTSYRVLDAAEKPTGPVTGRKQVVVGIAAGLFAGLLISALGVLALDKRREHHEVRREERQLARHRFGGRTDTPAAPPEAIPPVGLPPAAGGEHPPPGPTALRPPTFGAR